MSKEEYATSLLSEYRTISYGFPSLNKETKKEKVKSNIIMNYNLPIYIHTYGRPQERKTSCTQTVLCGVLLQSFFGNT